MNGWTLQPLAGLSLSRNKADGFAETGAGALNLQVAAQTIHSSKAMLGAKAFFDSGRIRLEPRVIWAHEFGDLNTPMTAQFQGAATASPFQVSGATLKRDTLILGLGASGQHQQGVDLFADVQTEHNSRQNNLAMLVELACAVVGPKSLRRPVHKSSTSSPCCTSKSSYQFSSDNPSPDDSTMNTTHRSIWNASLGPGSPFLKSHRACGKRSSTAVALVLIGSSVCSSVGAQDVSIDAGAQRDRACLPEQPLEHQWLPLGRQHRHRHTDRVERRSGQQ